MDIFLALVCVVFAITVVVSSNPVVSALSLMSMLIVMAAIFFQLGAIFLAAVQVLIYAGAIAILFVFVLMLLNLSELEFKSVKSRHLKQIVGVVLVSIVSGPIILVIHKNVDNITIDKLPQTGVHQLFEKILFSYAIPFELASLVLMSAMFVVVTLTKKKFRD